MKWIYFLAGAALTACFGLPFREYDTEKLLPIHTVQVEQTQDRVVILSDVGRGQGKDWESAVANLRETASGDVFFDTADRLIACTPALLRPIGDSGLIRPGAQVYYAKELQDPQGLTEYLAAHESPITMADVRGDRA